MLTSTMTLPSHHSCQEGKRKSLWWRRFWSSRCCTLASEKYLGGGNLGKKNNIEENSLLAKIFFVPWGWKAGFYCVVTRTIASLHPVQKSWDFLADSTLPDLASSILPVPGTTGKSIWTNTLAQIYLHKYVWTNWFAQIGLHLHICASTWCILQTQTN